MRLNASGRGVSWGTPLAEVDGDVEMTPRMRVGGALRAQWAAHADHARDVRDEAIHPATVSIGERTVIDERGRWVGDPTGLQGPAGPAGGGQRWPKDDLWHVGPFGTQSTILAKMGTLKILGTKVPQVPYCHMWHVVCLTWMWDSLIGQSEITGIFFTLASLFSFFYFVESSP